MSEVTEVAAQEQPENGSTSSAPPDFIQRILFGSPGTGKSHRVREVILPELGIEPDGGNCIQTVFHPEYSYGDFMGKLMPHTVSGSVKYNYYEGHFLKALAQAYENILNADEGQEPDHVALVIDEINRGNSASIFGTAFQLLDRDEDGWSEYAADVSKMEFNRLMEMIGIATGSKTVKGIKKTVYQFNDQEYVEEEINSFLRPQLHIRRGQIRLPSNLSLIATMNTSDHSVFHMDAAFKRRWAWQYMEVDGTVVREDGVAFEGREEWKEFVRRLNGFIKDNHNYVRNVEERLIGDWFLDSSTIRFAEVQNKLLFFLWDTVFERSKEPLANLLGLEAGEVATFGDFARHVVDFVDAISKRNP
jgi:5-methylcytosine-specific restriction endonuclease McrBC GTP-binding regulatory subunit McrB